MPRRPSSVAAGEARLHEEQTRPAPDIAMIQQIKKQKLLIKEELSSC